MSHDNEDSGSIDLDTDSLQGVAESGVVVHKLVILKPVFNFNFAPGDGPPQNVLKSALLGMLQNSLDADMGSDDENDEDEGDGDEEEDDSVDDSDLDTDSEDSESEMSDDNDNNPDDNADELDDTDHEPDDPEVAARDRELLRSAILASKEQ